MQRTPHGNIDQSSIGRKNDYLYRVSIKALIRNENGEVLVVKEAGRTWWDLPGGGMDHEESIKSALARELKEEVNLEGDFIYRVISVDEPKLLEHANVWQLRLIFLVEPAQMQISSGEDNDELCFIDPNILKDSANKVERSVYIYSQLARQRD